jgi:glycosyltransferase involved in cell wall biosynthesis
VAKVAVIVPVYNVAPYLRCCLDSLLGQGMRDFLLFLVDDGSTDGSSAICDEYAARDGRVRVFHRENAGQSAARNAALDIVLGEGLAEYVTFVDSDDWVLPTYLEGRRQGLALRSGVGEWPRLVALVSSQGRRHASHRCAAVGSTLRSW